jgi:hypothetical protein
VPDQVEAAPSHIYEADLDCEDNTATDVTSPTPPSSPDSNTESVGFAPSKEPLSPFHLAFGMWLEKASISRSEYKQLRQLWMMGRHLCKVDEESDIAESEDGQ